MKSHHNTVSFNHDFWICACCNNVVETRNQQPYELLDGSFRCITCIKREAEHIKLHIRDFVFNV